MQVKIVTRNHIVLIVIFSNIVVILLNENQIAHVRFKISSNFTFQNTCNIKKIIDRDTLIKQIKLIF